MEGGPGRGGRKVYKRILFRLSPSGGRRWVPAQFWEWTRATVTSTLLISMPRQDALGLQDPHRPLEVIEAQEVQFGAHLQALLSKGQ